MDQLRSIASGPKRGQGDGTVDRVRDRLPQLIELLPRHAPKVSTDAEGSPLAEGGYAASSRRPLPSGGRRRMPAVVRTVTAGIRHLLVAGRASARSEVEQGPEWFDRSQVAGILT